MPKRGCFISKKKVKVQIIGKKEKKKANWLWVDDPSYLIPRLMTEKEARTKYTLKFVKKL
jgi:hypothetical protein